MQREITIPEIEIADGWLVSELESVEDCDDALTFITDAIASIEHQLELHTAGVKVRGPEWKAAVSAALTWKRHAREAVFRKRAYLAHAERRAAEWIRINYPELWATGLEKTRGEALQ